MKNKLIKITAVLLLLTLLIPSFVGCKSQTIKPGKDALEVVGKVGNYDVTYEELYFLANSYKDILDSQYGADAYKSDAIITVNDENGEERSVKLSEYYVEEINQLIAANITSNYAVLTLAEKEGVSVEDKEFKAEVQRQLDLYIESEFDSSRKTYKEYLEGFHMTDNYVRFTLGVDIVYDRLATHYRENGTVPTTDKEIKDIINTHFVRTWHVMIPKDSAGIDGYAKATEILEKINSGEMSMYDAIKYHSKDLSLTTLDGYYFGRGMMDEGYEEAAYALEVNEISDVVTAIGKDFATDSKVLCYYIIQRLPLESEYIDEHFSDLKGQYISSVIYEKVEATEKTLEFTPNDYYKSLNILELEEPSSTDTRTVIVIAVLAGTVLLVVGGIFTLKAVRKNRRKKRA